MAMVERYPVLTFFSHVMLIVGVFIFAFPIYVVFVASSVPLAEIMRAPMPIIPAPKFYRTTVLL